MNAFLSTVMLLAALTQSSDSASNEPVYPISTSRNTPAAQQQTPGVQAVNGIQFSNVADFFGEQSSWERARETVLVIPAPDLPAESLKELTEDMTVMCRIFDKALLPMRVSFSTSAQTGQIFNYVMGQPTSAAQGLYLDGYGVLFFLQVDYPLAPTQQPDEQQSRPQEQGDPVWSQTIKEMAGRQEGQLPVDRSRVPYDPQRVESLKRTLIKTLAHAANIRTPRPQDRITLVVGALDDRAGYDFTRSTGISISVPGRGRLRNSSGRSRGARIETGAAPAAAGVMIMHVAKSDVDTFAKGRLTLAQFTEKVRTLWSPPDGSASTHNKAPAVPAPAASR
jgi:hypothetical protein